MLLDVVVCAESTKYSVLNNCCKRPINSSTMLSLEATKCKVDLGNDIERKYLFKPINVC